MIVDEPMLRKRFVLIGGTAINLFNPKIPRLSVDIDMDYIHRDKTPFNQNLVEAHSDILDRIAEELEMDYYRTTKKNSNRLGAVFHYKSNFTPSGEGAAKLDISYLMGSTIFPPIYHKIRQLYPNDGLRGLKVLTVHPCELWAGKALALVYRSKNDPKPKEAPELYSMFIARHLFDISQMEKKLREKKKTLDQNMLRTAFILKGVARIRDLFLLRGEMLRRCTQTEVEQQLYPYLREGVKPPLNDMKILSREFLDRVCSNKWNKKQKLFVKTFQQKGKYRPEMLFGKNNKKYQHLYYNEYLKQSARNMVK